MRVFLLSIAACLVAVNCDFILVTNDGEELYVDESTYDDYGNVYYEDDDKVYEEHFIANDGKGISVEHVNAVVRNNEVVIAVYAGISGTAAVTGKELLEALVAANADYEDILEYMYTFFSALSIDLFWHLTFEERTSYEITPTVYVHYWFDKNTTQLLITGYERTV